MIHQQNQKIKKKRKTKQESLTDRNYTCGCGKSYLSYPALYLHLKNKHDGQTPEGTKLPNKSNRRISMEKLENEKEIPITTNSTSLQNLMQVLKTSNNGLVREENEQVDILDPAVQLAYLEFFPKQDCFINPNDYQVLYSEFQNVLNSFKVNSYKINQLKLNILIDSENLELFDDGVEDINQNKCNQIFAMFLAQIAKHLTYPAFREICFYICVYRVTANQIGWESQLRVQQTESGISEIGNQVKQEDEYCQAQNGTYLLEVSNDFVLDFIPKYIKDIRRSDLKLNNQNLIQIILYFSQWLFENNFTHSKLELPSEQPKLE